MPIHACIQNKYAYLRYLEVKRAIHEFLHTHGFLELDLPVLLPELIPESYLEVFETEYRFMGKSRKLYLTPSPELLMKRLIVVGIGDCYYLGKSFRNSEPDSSKHSGEFTMLEMYKLNTHYLGLADIVLQMLRYIAGKIYCSHDSKIVYQGAHVDLSRWERLTVAEAFDTYAGIPPDILFDHEKFQEACVKKGYAVSKNVSYAELWSQVYTNEIESHMGMNGHPTLLYDYPVDFAALSKPNSDGTTAQRFEFYIAGVELGNCYSELTDWQLQTRRLQEEQKLRLLSGKIRHPIDHGFAEALKKGLPDCAGIAIGVERLGMIFADVSSIQNIRLIEIS
jgi:elongation factor P--beta-lysine ligase